MHSRPVSGIYTSKRYIIPSQTGEQYAEMIVAAQCGYAYFVADALKSDKLNRYINIILNG